MALLGIGSAQIDLILPKVTYKPSESINGYYLIKGGTIEQQLKRIDCELIEIDQCKEIEKRIDMPTILTSKLIQSEELYKVSFTFELPANLQASSEKISYQFHTSLIFNEGKESKDEDAIQIIY